MLSLKVCWIPAGRDLASVNPARCPPSSSGVGATGVCLKFKRAMPGLMLMALLAYFQLAQVGTESFVDVLSDDDGFRRYYRRY